MCKLKLVGRLCVRAIRALAKAIKLGTPPTTASPSTNLPAQGHTSQAPSTQQHPYTSAPSSALPTPGSTPLASTLPVQTHASILTGTVAWGAFRNALRGLYKSSVLFPPLRSVIERLISCVEAVGQSEQNKTEYVALARELTVLSESLDHHLQVSKSATMSEFIVRTIQSIQQQVDFIWNKQNRRELDRLAKAVQDEEEIMSCYRRVQALFRQLQLDAELSIWSVANEQLANARLKQLKPVRLATYNSSLSTEVNRRRCTDNTRTDVLSGLDTWSNDPDVPNVYWMNGMAGTGKTTIAFTFAGALKERKQLAASFFCTRTTAACRDVTRIIPTIAYQLARYSTPFQSALCRVLGNDPDIGSSTISAQFERLLKEPLLEVKNVIPEGLVVVIDALDECTANKGVNLVLDMLFRAAPNLPLKFFVTSRPEPSIWDKIQNKPPTLRSVFVLHDIEESLVQADIELYLREELVFITPHQVKQLAELSGKLFIYAATAVRYIKIGKAFGDLEGRLRTMLSITATSANKHAEIDQLYASILSAAIGNKSLEKDDKESMRLVLWTAICAREPISVDTLAELAGIGSPTRTLAMLQPLRSVLYVSDSNSIVTSLHASFPDFLTDKSRSLAFFCNTERHSQLLAQRCLELMEGQLRFDICGLKSSDQSDDEVPNMKEIIGRAISPTLAYACRYWGDHLQQVSVPGRLHELLQIFFSKHLLSWMEVMNLKRWMGIGIRLILKAKEWLTIHHGSSKLLKFAEDARNFVTMFAANAVSQSTLQLYVSAVPFCHKASAVFEHYSGQTRGLACVRGTGIEQRGVALLATWRVDSSVNTVAYSSDGIQLAIGCQSGDIIVKDAYDGTLIGAPFKGHSNYVTSIEFSPDGSYIVSGSGDRTIRVWNVHNGTPIAPPFEGHTAPVTSVGFSPDGLLIISGSQDSTVRVWSIRDCKLVGTPLEGHASWVTSIAFSPDGSRIASGSNDRTIRIWNTQEGVPVGSPFLGHTGYVTSVGFSPDGSRIVSGSRDKSIRVWSAQDGTPIHSPFDGHKDWVTSVAFSPDGSRIVSGSEDRTICVWDTESGTLIGTPLKGHTSYVRSVAFSPDGSRVVSGSEDRTVRVWNIQDDNLTSVPFNAHDRSIRFVAFSPDGLRLVSGSDEGTICVWSIHDGVLVSPPFMGHPGVKSLAFSPDGSRIAIGSDCTIYIWNINDGSHTCPPLKGHTSYVRAVAFSSDGSHIVSGSDDRTVRIWDTGNGTQIGTPLIGHTRYVRSVAFSPDGSYVVSGSEDRTIRVWNAQSGTLVGAPFKGHTGYVTSIAFSPDGSCIASGSEDRTVRVWKIQDGTLMKAPLTGHTGYVRSVAFSPDGSRIASGSNDKTIRVWDARTGTLVGTPLKGHGDWVRSVAFSPDNSHIVSGSKDRTIRIWNAPGNTSTTDSWTISDNGWLRSNSQLLFWVPPDIIHYLSLPNNPWTAGPNGVARVDYSGFLPRSQ